MSARDVACLSTNTVERECTDPLILCHSFVPVRFYLSCVLLLDYTRLAYRCYRIAYRCSCAGSH